MPLPEPTEPRRLLAEQAALLYRNAPITLGGGMVMAVILTVAIPVAPQIRLAWLAAMIAVTAARVLLVLRYQSRDSEDPRWARRSALGSLAAGVLWGSAGVLMYVPGSMTYQLLLWFTLLGMASSSVYALTAYLPAFYAFLLSSILPVAMVQAFNPDAVHRVLAAMTVLYSAATAAFGWNLHRLLVDSILRRFENIDLIAQLEHERDLAEQANASKSRFLAAASHDLRQPVHAIALFVEQLRGEVGDRPGAKKVVDYIARSVEEMGSLFNALLDISRLDAGVVMARRMAIPIKPVFDRLHMLFRPIAAQRGLRLRLRSSDAWVEADPVLLEQALANLVSNAIKFTMSGGVLVGCRRRGASLAIQVWDTGCGIAPAYRNRIFEEFFQIDNPERDRSNGLGLGLSIVQRIAGLMNAAIEVRSVEQRGSMFSIALPQTASRRTDDTAAPTCGSTEIRLQGALIAVVDDEAVIRQAVQGALERFGCRVLCADGTDDLLAALDRYGETPAALITDYRLRAGEDGITLVQRLRRSIGADIPAILVTGDTAPERIRDAETSGLPILHKPVAPARLRSLLSAILAGTEVTSQ
ncbi:integral membrane sensor hybrid histidine kinase [Burkholderiales bacterium GJ-E10]|nr:integral membrane sensor hybrid histidine kinase [Burkholderiales bacterium GJ-E10]